MKNWLLAGSIILLTSFTNRSATPTAVAVVSPLNQFSEAWNDERYEVANSAGNATYMTKSEREVIQILNLARMNPALFESTVLTKYPEFSGKLKLKSSNYYKSLSATLKTMASLSILLPNNACFESARCHALTSGEKSYVGHDRLTADCKKSSFYFGECISYGYDKPLDIVMALLIDEDVPSLGHRKNFLGDFKSVAVSIQPHTTYRYNTVIDLAY